MTETDEIYEKLRQILSPSICYELPQNELTDKLIRNIFTEEEAIIVANGMKKALRPITIRRIKKRIKIQKKELKEKLNDMAYRGKIIKKGPFCVVLGYLPGLFELYFTINRDDPERIKKAGEAHYELLKIGFNAEHSKSGSYPLFRVIPAIDPINTTLELEINQSIDVKHQILPYEVLEKYLSKQKIFAIQPCSCRTAAKLSGNPCKKTDENFCVSAGLLAKEVIKNGSGRKVSLEELIEIMKKAEKEGLIHQSTNMKKTSLFICNCCPCCCGAFKQVKELGKINIVSQPNFHPEVEVQKCAGCKTCVKICPMEVITYEETVLFNLDNCIGCGLCASNCPKKAIKLKKIGNQKLVKGNIGIFRKLMKDGKKRTKL